MITTADLITAISKKLKTNYPGTRVWSTDKDKDFGKKCFFIKYTSSKGGKPEFIHEWGEVRVYYFPSDEDINQIELLKMQEQLSQLFLFRIFVTDTFAVPIDEVQFEIDDDVLVMSRFAEYGRIKLIRLRRIENVGGKNGITKHCGQFY